MEEQKENNQEDSRSIGKEYTLKQYECRYCGYEFKQFVRSVMTNKPSGYEQTVALSSQVRCPKCKGFLRTWEDGKELAIYKTKPSKRQYTMDEEIK